MGKRKIKQQRDDSVDPHSPENVELSEEQNVGEGNDIISRLPDNVLHHILSFLSTEDAIQTSILSKRWEYLWTSIANIDLSETYHLNGKKENGNFLDFVERVVLLHDASDIKILSLVLYECVDSARLNSWISTLIKHNIEELNLSLHGKKTEPVLPCCLFTCQSLLVLKLSMYSSLKVPSSTQLSNLKTLELSNVTFSDDNSTQLLFSSCSVLQELALVNCGWKNLNTITICIPTLKRLTIDNRKEPRVVLSCVIKIYAANLIHLNCFCCLTVDFRLCELSSLVDASVWLNDAMVREDIARRLLRLLSGVFNVKKLTITIAALEYLAGDENLVDHLPTFYNMTDLVLKSDLSRHSFFGVMMDVLRKSPQLESLDFEGGFNPRYLFLWMLTRVPSCFTSSLKTVRIAFTGMPVEKLFIRYVLNKATVLERLTLFIYLEDIKKQQQQLSSQLNDYHKGSKSCVIEFISS